jgi:hypothetical protein
MNKGENMNYLALRIPHFQAQVEIKTHPHLAKRAFALCTSLQPTGEVMSISSDAATLGARVGQRRLRLPVDVEALLFSGDRVRSAEEDLHAHLCQRLPRVESKGEAHFLIHLKGTKTLHPDSLQLGRELLASLKQDLGLDAAIGIANSALGATLIARRAHAGEVHAFKGHEEQSVLDAFPLHFLDLRPAFLSDLAKAGVSSIGDAKRVHKGQLAQIYGAEGRNLTSQLMNLDCAPEAKVKGNDRIRTGRRPTAATAQPPELRRLIYDMLDELLDRAGQVECELTHLLLQLSSSDGHSVLRGLPCRVSSGKSARQQLRSELLHVLDQALGSRRAQIQHLEIQALLRPASQQMPLFIDGRDRRTPLEESLRELRTRFGSSALQVGCYAIPPMDRFQRKTSA